MSDLEKALLEAIRIQTTGNLDDACFEMQEAIDRNLSLDTSLVDNWLSEINTEDTSNLLLITILVATNLPNTKFFHRKEFREKVAHKLADDGWDLLGL